MSPLTITKEESLMRTALAALDGHDPQVLTCEQELAIEEDLIYTASYDFDDEEEGYFPIAHLDTIVDVSLSTTGEATFELDNWKTQERLLEGECAHLAWTAHQLCPLPFVVFTLDSEHSERGWQGHVALKVGEGLVLDAKGIRTYEEVAEAYKVNAEHPYAIREVEEDEFLTIQKVEKSFTDFYADFRSLEREWLGKMARDMLVKHLPALLA